ncbi:MAG: SRPBCC family protein [Cytophagales bacterium]
MKIIIKTQVENTMENVWKGFDERLFAKLSPPFPKVEILRFDGCKKGNEVHLKLLFPFIPQLWFAEIIDNSIAENEIYFVDKGTKLPFFLSKWQHKHRIQKAGGHTSIIVDDIDFNTGTILTDLLFYPLLYLQFLYRVPIYKKYFKN